MVCTIAVVLSGCSYVITVLCTVGVVIMYCCRRAMEGHIKKFHPQLAEEIEESEKNETPASEHSYYTYFSPQSRNMEQLPGTKPTAPSGEEREPGSLIIRLPKDARSENVTYFDISLICYFAHF